MWLKIRLWIRIRGRNHNTSNSGHWTEQLVSHTLKMKWRPHLPFQVAPRRELQSHSRAWLDCGVTRQDGGGAAAVKRGRTEASGNPDYLRVREWMNHRIINNSNDCCRVMFMVHGLWYMVYGTWFMFLRPSECLNHRTCIYHSDDASAPGEVY